MDTDVGRIRAAVRAFILDRFYVPSPAELGDATSLLEQAVVDSTGVQEIIAFIEEEYRIRVENEEILPENLDSVDRLARYVWKKIRGGARSLRFLARVSSHRWRLNASPHDHGPAAGVQSDGSRARPGCDAGVFAPSRPRWGRVFDDGRNRRLDAGPAGPREHRGESSRISLAQLARP